MNLLEKLAGILLSSDKTANSNSLPNPTFGSFPHSGSSSSHGPSSNRILSLFIVNWNIFFVAINEVDLKTDQPL